ncbi:MAG: DNA cytosine methyltransferase [Symploca sp. SIO2C1]|nr:DNA cytosine methyltransferase [Symploca sp. SIO2C1]
MRKPKLKKDAPIAVTLFSAGGGIEGGLVGAGIRPVASVDCDPNNKIFSRQMKFCRDANYQCYGGESYLATVEEMASKDFPGIPRNPFLLHASPVCSSFSSLSHLTRRREGDTDISAAKATATAIATLQPQWFTLENAVKYYPSKSCRIIIDALIEHNYDFVTRDIDMADWGVPQNRERLILVARKNAPVLGKVFLPRKERRGWDSCIEGFAMPRSRLTNLLKAQKKSVLSKSLETDFKMAIIQRGGVCTGSGHPKSKNKSILRMEGEPSFTITRSMFIDSKGGSRSGAITYWDNLSQEAYQLPMRVIARIGGFPEWYRLPDRDAIAGSIIGLSVPPYFAKQLFLNLLAQN